MIWANATRFGKNFSAPPKFFGLVRLWRQIQSEDLFLEFITFRNKTQEIRNKSLYCLVFSSLFMLAIKYAKRLFLQSFTLYFRETFRLQQKNLRSTGLVYGKFMKQQLF